MLLADILKQAMEKKTFIDVTLISGRQFQAKVKDLSGDLVVFAQVPGREFFEVFVPIQHIVAVEVRIS